MRGDLISRSRHSSAVVNRVEDPLHRAPLSLRSVHCGSSCLITAIIRLAHTEHPPVRFRCFSPHMLLLRPRPIYAAVHSTICEDSNTRTVNKKDVHSRTPQCTRHEQAPSRMKHGTRPVKSTDPRSALAVVPHLLAWTWPADRPCLSLPLHTVRVHVCPTSRLDSWKRALACWKLSQSS